MTLKSKKKKFPKIRKSNLILEKLKNKKNKITLN